MVRRKSREWRWYDVDKSEVIVLRDLNKLPVFEEELISPNLSLCIYSDGIARLLYDSQEVSLHKNEVAVLMPNHKVQVLENSADHKVTIVVLSSDFVAEMQTRALTYSYAKFHQAPFSELTEEHTTTLLKVVDIIDYVSRSSEQDLPHRHDLLLYIVDLAFELIHSSRQAQDELDYGRSRNAKLFNDFCKLLAEHYVESHEVLYYASKLGLTSKHFSKVIKSLVGVTAGEWIEDFLIVKAKRMLSSRRDLTVQQVAMQLGFNSQSAFCRFYKRTTGESPVGYRKSLANNITVKGNQYKA